MTKEGLLRELESFSKKAELQWPLLISFFSDPEIGPDEWIVGVVFNSRSFSYCHLLKIPETVISIEQEQLWRVLMTMIAKTKVGEKIDPVLEDFCLLIGEDEEDVFTIEIFSMVGQRIVDIIGLDFVREVFGKEKIREVLEEKIDFLQEIAEEIRREKTSLISNTPLTPIFHSLLFQDDIIFEVAESIILSERMQYVDLLDLFSSLLDGLPAEFKEKVEKIYSFLRDLPLNLSSPKEVLRRVEKILNLVFQEIFGLNLKAKIMWDSRVHRNVWYFLKDKNI